jgi:hypothetical protein
MALGGVARDQEKSSAWCAVRQHRLIWNPSTLARVSIVNVALRTDGGERSTVDSEVAEQD